MRSFTGLVLSTTRLTLRALQMSDSEPLFRIHTNVEFMRYLGSAPWTGRDRAEKVIADDLQKLAEGIHLRLGIVRRDDEVLIGACSLFMFDERNRRAEISYGIAAEHWRQGYMTESVTALIRFAFLELGLHRLEADVDPRNLASIGGLEKLGFVREGLLRERWIVGDEVSDSVILGLLASQFRDPGARSG